MFGVAVDVAATATLVVVAAAVVAVVVSTGISMLHCRKFADQSKLQG